MENDLYRQIKLDASRLQHIPESTCKILESSLPKLLALVQERFSLELKYISGEESAEQLRFLHNSNKNFGEMLLGIYAFNLQESLVDEFLWLAKLLCNRGFEVSYGEKILKAWAIAIHSVIKPPESHALARPLEFLQGHLSSLAPINLDLGLHASEQLQQCLSLVLAKNRKDVVDFVLSLFQKGFSLERLYAEIITGVLEQVGVLWQQNKISVVDVHVATDICRYIMFRIADEVTMESSLPYRVMVMCVPGEEHEIGSEIVESYLETKGWTIISMGHIAPLEDILNAISHNKPDIVFLSVTLIAHLVAARELSVLLKKEFPAVKIVIGGRAAILAKEKLQNFCDAIAADLLQTHVLSLKLVNEHADEGSL